MSPLSPPEASLIEGLDRDSMLDQTISWAEVNSGTTNLSGLDTMARLLADAFSALPGELSLVEPDPVEKIGADGKIREVACGRHLVVCVRPEADRRVLLTGHMDTVYAGDHSFQSCAWIDERTLHGPGTADMKGGLALMLAGLIAFERSGPTLGYDILINSDEETGSLSSRALIAQLAHGKFAALTYEPALPNGNFARARPGSGNFAAVVTGRSAHAGRNPEEGRNAVVAAADLAQRLAALARPGLSVNPARIEGGGPNNLVPALAILHFNMRPHTPETMHSAQTELDEIVSAVSVAHDVSIALHGGFGRPPKPISAATQRLFELVSRTASDLGYPVDWQDTGGVCDGNNIAACGVPVIDTMGALGGAIHSPDEYLLVDSLVPRAALTALTMHRLQALEALS